MNYLEFQEAIRHLYCMNLADFKRIFEDGEYLFDKFKDEFKNDAGQFICYLDLNNMRSLFEEFKTHNEKFKEVLK